MTASKANGIESQLLTRAIEALDPRRIAQIIDKPMDVAASKFSFTTTGPLTGSVTRYRLPYLSITPTFSTCKDHGYLRGEHFACPHCGGETEVWSRVTGYLRPVAHYNDGKKQEYADRQTFRIPECVAAEELAL